MGRDLALEERVQHDPAAVLADVTERLSHVRDRDAPELVRIAAMAQMRLSTDAVSLALGRRAVRAARASAEGDAAVSRALATLAAGLANAGRLRQAAAAGDEALRLTSADDRGMALVHRGIVHASAGERREATRLYQQAERAFRGRGELTRAAGARLNVGMVRALSGDGRGALADLDEVDRLIAAGADLPRYMVAINRAHALVQIGDYAGAMAVWEFADRTLRELGLVQSWLQIDELEALARVGLSLTVLQRAAGLLQLRLAPRDRAAIELLVADAYRSQGDPAAALAAARRARRRLQPIGDGRDASLAIVTAAEVARSAGRRVVRADIQRAATTARRVNDRPLTVRAESLLNRLGAGRRPRLERAHGDPAAEVAVLLAQAEAAIARGRRGQLLRALDRLSQLRHERRERSSTVRAPASAPAGTADLAAMALRAAMANGSPSHLAAVVVRLRALLLPLGGRLPSTDASGSHLDFFTLGGDVVRCATVEGRATASHAGTVADVTRLTRFARLERARAARAGGAVASGAAGELAEQLLGDGPPGGDAPLLVTAPPRLAFVPWGALPHLQPRTWSLVVAAGSEARPEPSTRDVTVMVGPEIPNGTSEATRVAGHYHRVDLVDGSDATPARALTALRRDGVVHLAAHAGRRGDDPLLSWIELAGGALSNATLGGERVRAGCVVLSACEAAAAAGDVSAGIVTPAAIIVRCGAGAVVAATDPVHHDAAELLMDGLHGGLAAGTSPAEALRAAWRGQPENPAADSFICLTGVT